MYPLIQNEGWFSAMKRLAAEEGYRWCVFCVNVLVWNQEEEIIVGVELVVRTDKLAFGVGL